MHLLDREYISLEFTETSKYVAKKDGPGCPLEMDVKMQDCQRAAQQLGFIATEVTLIHRNNNVTRIPLGCLVKRKSDIFAPDDGIWFNTMAPKETGDPAILSICTKLNQQGEYLEYIGHRRKISRTFKVFGASDILLILFRFNSNWITHSYNN